MKREYALVFLSPLLLVVVGIGILSSMRKARRDFTTERVPGEALYREVMVIATNRYVVEPDVERLSYGAAAGVASRLDRYCRIYEPAAWNRQERQDQGHYVGVGIRVAAVSGRILVLRVVPKGPAARAGVKEGDTILSIDGQELGGDFELTRKLLKGEGGTTLDVALRGLEAPDETRKTTIKRGLAVEESAYGALVDRPRATGYIRLTGFRKDAPGSRSGTLSLFDAAYAELVREGMERLVLDLRGNRGGLLDVAVGIADRFIDHGPLVTTVGRLGRVQRQLVASEAQSSVSMPCVVLIDRNAASASEVLAGALQDHARAVLVGERSYGKGVVQGIFEFRSSPGGMKLTTAHYVTPAGRMIEKSLALPGGVHRRGGLLPDVVVNMKEKERVFAERRVNDLRYSERIRSLLEADRSERGSPTPANADPQLEAAIAVLEGQRPKSSAR